MALVPLVHWWLPHLYLKPWRFLQLQTRMPNCLFDISTWMSKKYLKLNMFKNNLLISVQHRPPPKKTKLNSNKNSPPPPPPSSKYNQNPITPHTSTSTTAYKPRSSPAWITAADSSKGWTWTFPWGTLWVCAHSNPFHLQDRLQLLLSAVETKI